jgi:hypothetical protein
LIETLKTRFHAHAARHGGVSWNEVVERLHLNPEGLRALASMEASGGEPDVVGRDARTGAVLFIDCAPESPSGRRSICYDRAGADSRKDGLAAGNAVDLAAQMGISLLTESDYRALQELGEFDTKTSSWIETPQDVRARGGALFCDRRYGRVFTYHNGAQSFYAARGFRGKFRL